MITTESMGRTWDGLCKGSQAGSAIVTDGWTIKPKAGDVAIFFTGDRQRVRGFDGVTLNLEGNVSVTDNCAIWIGDGL